MGFRLLFLDDLREKGYPCFVWKGFVNMVFVCVVLLLDFLGVLEGWKWVALLRLLGGFFDLQPEISSFGTLGLTSFPKRAGIYRELFLRYL